MTCSTNFGNSGLVRLGRSKGAAAQSAVCQGWPCGRILPFVSSGGRWWPWREQRRRWIHRSAGGFCQTALKSSGGDDDGIDLRGIISTNDDPFACAQCRQPLMLKSDLRNKVFSVDCCGKRICAACLQRKDGIAVRFIADLSGQIRCAMCKAVQSYGSVQPLRDQAHLGRPYAQFEFATEVQIDGYPRDAIIWREKAAAQGHPHAFICLAASIRNGVCCKRDLALARMYAERAKELHVAYAPLANAELATIAQVYMYLDEGSASVASEIVNSLLCHQFDDKPNPVGEVPIDYVCCERLVPLLGQLGYCENQIRTVQARRIKLQIQHRIVSPLEYAIDSTDGGVLALAKFFLQCIASEGYLDKES